MELEPFNVAQVFAEPLRAPLHEAAFGMDMSDALGPFGEVSPLAAYEADSLAGMGDVFAVDAKADGLVVTIYCAPADMPSRVDFALRAIEAAYAVSPEPAQFATLGERLPHELEIGDGIAGVRLHWALEWKLA